MAYEQVLLEKDGPAAIITLNRPEKLNAFTNQLGRELADAIRAALMLAYNMQQMALRLRKSERRMLN